MTLFNYTDYKAYIRERINAMPLHGRGQYSKIAATLKVNTSMVSQIFRANKDLTLEQADELASYLGFSELESEYFLTLIQIERAGTPSLRKRFQKHLAQIKDQSLQVKNRINPKKTLDSELQAIFYSNWFYSGVRLLTSIPKYQNIDSIADALKLSRTTVVQTMDFLLKNGLCKKNGDKIEVGPTHTHVDADSPFVSRHHANWRMKSMETFGRISKENLVFSAPLTISHSDSALVREELMKAIEKITQIVSKSKEEKMSCLNIDWVDIVS